jgi:hypothetical protein
VSKTYTFKWEESDEFWESLTGTGCDQVYEWIKDLLETGGGLQTDGDYKNCDLVLTDFSAKTTET